MAASVVRSGSSHRLVGESPMAEAANRFLEHLEVRRYSPATVRAYAFDLLNFNRSSKSEDSAWAMCVRAICSTTWTGNPTARRTGPNKVVPLASPGVAPATMNRRMASVRGSVRAHGDGRGTERQPGAGRTSLKRLARTAPWVARPRQFRDGRGEAAGWFANPSASPRASTSTMCVLSWSILGRTVTGRSCSPWCSGVFGRARFVPSACLMSTWACGVSGWSARVVGSASCRWKSFFSRVCRVRRDRAPAGCPTPECFVVLHGPTRGSPLTEAGLRKMFRTHRARSGATRVRPHRLRHTYGTELAAAGIDLLACENSWAMPRPRRRRATCTYPPTPWPPSSPRLAQRSGDDARPRIGAFDDLMEAYRRDTRLMPVNAGLSACARQGGRVVPRRSPGSRRVDGSSGGGPTGELSGRPDAWPVVGFALLSGRCRADLEFLVAKRFGHSAGGRVAILYRGDVDHLREASRRLGRSETQLQRCCSDGRFPGHRRLRRPDLRTRRRPARRTRRVRRRHAAADRADAPAHPLPAVLLAPAALRGRHARDATTAAAGRGTCDMGPSG